MPYKDVDRLFDCGKDEFKTSPLGLLRRTSDMVVLECISGNAGRPGSIRTGKQVRILMRMDDTNTLTITPMRLGDRKDFVAENLPWNGTAEENIERYQREVPTEGVDHVKTTNCAAWHAKSSRR